jgi:hypothetical protein
VGVAEEILMASHGGLDARFVVEFSACWDARLNTHDAAVAALCTADVEWLDPVFPEPRRTSEIEGNTGGSAEASPLPQRRSSHRLAPRLLAPVVQQGGFPGNGPNSVHVVHLELHAQLRDGAIRWPVRVCRSTPGRCFVSGHPACWIRSGH